MRVKIVQQSASSTSSGCAEQARCCYRRRIALDVPHAVGPATPTLPRAARSPRASPAPTACSPSRSGWLGMATIGLNALRVGRLRRSATASSSPWGRCCSSSCWWATSRGSRRPPCRRSTHVVLLGSGHAADRERAVVVPVLEPGGLAAVAPGWATSRCCGSGCCARSRRHAARAQRAAQRWRWGVLLHGGRARPGQVGLIHVSMENSEESPDRLLRPTPTTWGDCWGGPADPPARPAPPPGAQPRRVDAAPRRSPPWAPSVRHHHHRLHDRFFAAGVAVIATSP